MMKQSPRMLYLFPMNETTIQIAQVTKHGAPNVMQFKESLIANPKPNELQIEIHFSGINLMQQLLENEGIVVKENQIQNFKIVFWDPTKELT